MGSPSGVRVGRGGGKPSVAKECFRAKSGGAVRKGGSRVSTKAMGVPRPLCPVFVRHGAAPVVSCGETPSMMRGSKEKCRFDVFLWQTRGAGTAVFHFSEGQAFRFPKTFTRLRAPQHASP
ncbi:hypothetical protein, unlikely [Trypanosoma brucei gambiense DAL972]|uniref:Uncharacterized protein n=1 Tax=Trypanosoma brucei gambiense (strain MHOM/CI/86/DAL972) TaxID=679716 RepID=C9ZP13_TRYB9|nr:hypothetical protein, unlikely [Trypanosoma brucei gambiense DAL972]CBH11141.1 hypothetical protein, unlikely [Trypanosoma brucei gambiense DAL972]|eukprot:XP_011773428.1 hypothetical protein, unlikely [Trypanosoma brucei gambiense DAL972]